ncbi:DUF3425 domain-containing protein [Aspergillus undulatus]|uniref:DUF3425 domain-containing protein n=1 Tax=Aspergillus undulatus TaxID=1810928 RepID=UPI003CCCACA6
MDVKMLDEWKGVTDPKARRTLQNRLNQRAHRRRQRERPKKDKQPTTSQSPKDAEIESDYPVELEQRCPVENAGASGRQRINFHFDFAALDNIRILGPDADHDKKVLRHLEALLYAQYTTSHLNPPSPKTDLLPTLTRVNFLRALHANIEVMGYSASEMHDDALSHFGTAGPIKPSIRDISVLPVCLRPTKIQIAVPHHPWIDLLPIPTMRDNLILAGEEYDDIALCRAMSGYGVNLATGKKAGDARGETGVIIWRDPWDADGWEVTGSFLRRWGWTVAGCEGLFRATNWWRSVRGEPPLFRL